MSVVRNKTNSANGNPIRVYQCSCGKTYKSYPALYTHTKNKHSPTALQFISKAPCEEQEGNKTVVRKSTRRTRQRKVSVSKQKMGNQCWTLSPQQPLIVATKSRGQAECILETIKILLNLPNQNYDYKNIRTMASLWQMNVLLASLKKQPKQPIPQPKYIGHVLVQFLNIISEYVDWPTFQKIVTPLMFLVQFIIDEENTRTVLRVGPIDLLFEHINDFLQIGLPGMTIQHEMENLHSMKESTVLDFCQLFFEWLVARKYTNYQITLNTQFKNIQTKVSF